MSERSLLIASGSLDSKTLNEQVAVVTGAGSGIGFEAARSMAWLGANLIIAEIDRKIGRQAAADINREMGREAAFFIATDLGNVRSVNRMTRLALKVFGKVDIIVNNAAVTPLGAVTDSAIEEWDLSYSVNLRGPVLLARAFLPGMLERNKGIFVCVSSVGEAYMGAYESLKAAQVHLARTLEAELEGSGVNVFSIGPGLVYTTGALEGIEKLAPLYGKTVEEFFEMSKDHVIAVEAAGAGFAAAVALADQFRGMEIDSRTALAAAGVVLSEDKDPQPAVLDLTPEDAQRAVQMCRRVRKTLDEQHQGWLQRPLFERQWMLRNFKQVSGLTAEQWLEVLDQLEQALIKSDPASLGIATNVPLGKLAHFYENLRKLSKGYIKDPTELEEALQQIDGWQKDVDELAGIFKI
jgi:NAD(P)-dependent dehydrogenase (short-subunit alcohol dehydrogenase family)